MPISNWQEWHQRCLLARCEPETQAVLREFVSKRFRGAARRCAPYAGVGESMARQEAGDAWHQFESFLALRRNRGDKPYKQWIFDRVVNSDDPPLRVVLGGVALLIRWVVRTQLKNEYSPPKVQSLSEPLPHRGGMVLEELIPTAGTPVDDVVERECCRLADEDAEAFLKALNEQERLVMWAKQHGISLASPELEQRAGVKRSRLNIIYHQTMHRLVEWSNQRHGREDGAMRMQLALKTLDALKRKISRWSAVEMGEARCFPSQKHDQFDAPGRPPDGCVAQKAER